jgi:hypothetical protein
MESIPSADFTLLAEFLNPAKAGLILNLSSIQTLAVIFQAEPENSDPRKVGQAWLRGPDFQGLNKKCTN